MGKIAKNLSLEPEAVARGERYARRHGKNLSQRVNDFLRGLPWQALTLATGTGRSPRLPSPILRQLLGVAISRTPATSRPALALLSVATFPAS